MPLMLSQISGGPLDSGTPLWTIDLVRPYVTFLLDAFGVERCMYAGNWFWVNNDSTLGRWSLGLWEIVRNVLDEHQLHQLYVATADTVYRLE
jgi:predicted TIM-barrel fold metal-dependent hydrolase